MNLLPTVILYKIFISNNIRLPDRHKIIFHRNFYRNFSHILQLIKVFRCLTHDSTPEAVYYKYRSASNDEYPNNVWIQKQTQPFFHHG